MMVTFIGSVPKEITSTFYERFSGKKEYLDLAAAIYI